MTRPAIAVLISCLSICFPPLASAAPAAQAFPRALPSENFRDVLVEAGDRLFVAGQPTEAGLEQMANAGVVTVVNLRTHREMNDRGIVPFDEAAKAAALDLEYVHIPSGGPETPYAPDMVDRFAEVMATTEGKVLLHCTVAWRASHLYVAYLHEHLGLPLSEAVRHGQAINFGTLPLEGFLGTPLSIEAVSVDGAASEE